MCLHFFQLALYLLHVPASSVPCKLVYFLCRVTVQRREKSRM